GGVGDDGAASARVPSSTARGAGTIHSRYARPSPKSAGGSSRSRRGLPLYPGSGSGISPMACWRPSGDHVSVPPCRDTSTDGEIGRPGEIESASPSGLTLVTHVEPTPSRTE